MTGHGIIFALAAAVTLPPVDQPAQSRTPTMVLEPMTSDEVARAGAAGVGCSWALPREVHSRLGMADGHAAVRVGGHVLRLRPLPDAAELAPFTYDGWTGDGLTLRVRPGGPARVRGGLVARTATVEVRRSSRTLRYTGQLTCGD